jgi:hypothetical protein
MPRTGLCFRSAGKTSGRHDARDLPNRQSLHPDVETAHGFRSGPAKAGEGRLTPREIWNWHQSRRKAGVALPSPGKTRETGKARVVSVKPMKLVEREQPSASFVGITECG